MNKISSYIHLPYETSSLTNIRNFKDKKCFLWCILSKKHKDFHNKERICNHKKYENEINMEGIEHPVEIKDIPIIEKNNNLTINVYSFKDYKDKTSLFPIYVSDKKDTKEEDIIDLLYLEKKLRKHYCLIENLNKFKEFLIEWSQNNIEEENENENFEVSYFIGKVKNVDRFTWVEE